MSKYDDPGPGHSQAVRQLAESRAELLSILRKLNSAVVGGSGPHENLIRLSNAPNLRTVATADLSDYLLQLRPYRAHSSSWQTELGVFRLPESFAAPKPTDPGSERYFEIEGSPEISITSLDDVLELAGHTVTYSAPKVGKTNMGRDARDYMFSLTPAQIRTLFAAADDVAEQGGFLADLAEPDTTDAKGW